jgi:hypothetical protein
MFTIRLIWGKVGLLKMTKCLNFDQTMLLVWFLSLRELAKRVGVPHFCLEGPLWDMGEIGSTGSLEGNKVGVVTLFLAKG